MKRHKSVTARAIGAGVMERKPAMPSPKRFTDKKKQARKTACRGNQGIAKRFKATVFDTVIVGSNPTTLTKN